MDERGRRADRNLLKAMYMYSIINWQIIKGVWMKEKNYDAQSFLYLGQRTINS